MLGLQPQGSLESLKVLKARAKAEAIANGKQEDNLDEVE